MTTDNRTIYDLSDEEYEIYETNPDKYADVTSNTEESNLDMMFPDREEDDGDDLW